MKIISLTAIDFKTIDFQSLDNYSSDLDKNLVQNKFINLYNILTLKFPFQGLVSKIFVFILILICLFCAYLLGVAVMKGEKIAILFFILEIILLFFFITLLYSLIIFKDNYYIDEKTYEYIINRSHFNIFIYFIFKYYNGAKKEYFNITKKVYKLKLSDDNKHLLIYKIVNQKEQLIHNIDIIKHTII